MALYFFGHQMVKLKKKENLNIGAEELSKQDLIQLFV